jgi:sugar phosphate isomerase/epimerase
MTTRRGYGYKLTVRVSDVERRRLAQEAGRAGLSVSRYLAESGLLGCPPPSAEDRAQRQRAIFHAKKIGTNLNQIAHQLNADGVVPPPELREALAATTQALARLAGKEPP